MNNQNNYDTEKHFNDTISDFEYRIEEKNLYGFKEHTIKGSYVLNWRADKYEKDDSEVDDGCREIQDVPFDIYCKYIDSLYGTECYFLYETENNTDDITEIIDHSFKPYEIMRDLYNASKHWEETKDANRKYLAEVTVRVNAHTKAQAELRAKKITKIINDNFDCTALKSVSRLR